MSHYNPKQTKWDPSFRLVTITFPVKQSVKYYSKRKFKIIVHYETDGIKNGQKVTQKHQKCIYFGLNGVPNKIDGQWIKDRRKLRDDLFHPYFWQEKLLNNKNTLEQAFLDVIKALKIV